MGEHKHFLRYIHENLSLTHIRSALSEATDDDFIQVQAELGRIGQFLERVIRSVEEEKLREKLLQNRIGPGCFWGGILTIIFITLRYQGLGSVYEELLSPVLSPASAGVEVERYMDE